MNGTVPRSWVWVGGTLVLLAFVYLPTLGISAGQLGALLMVLLCPLMHFFMMRHGGHGSPHGPERANPLPPSSALEADAPALPEPPTGDRGERDA